jgi:hypothetical protein
VLLQAESTRWRICFLFNFFQPLIMFDPFLAAAVQGVVAGLFDANGVN